MQYIDLWALSQYIENRSCASMNELMKKSDGADRQVSGDPIPAACGIIAVHLRDLRQLFDSLDPSPFHEKDLDKDAEEYIVGSALELSSKKPLAMVVDLDQDGEIPDEGQVIGNAVRTHFERLASQSSQELKQFLRRGRLSLIIGLVFSGLCRGRRSVCPLAPRRPPHWNSVAGGLLNRRLGGHVASIGDFPI
jgi:hypothetical protein